MIEAYAFISYEHHGTELAGLLHRGEHGARAQRHRSDFIRDLAHELLPAVHRVAALLKRWLLGTHQGSMIGGHLPAYLDEFTFRFNRRRAPHRGLVFYRLLQLAVGAPPVTSRELVVNSKPKGVRPAGVLGPRGRPGTLALPPADKPWRQTQSLD